MKNNRAILTAVVVVLVVVLGWFLFGRRGAGEHVDLIERFADAQKRPDPALFSVADVTLAGETRRAIAVMPTVGTRIVWNVRIPDDGWLRVALGMHPDSWEQEGDGVNFLVGISDGRAFETLFEHHLHPFANTADRKWAPLTVDLSSYAGEEVELIFNTYSHLPGESDDQRGDLPLWGDPEIVIR
jgi:hypothetical protein